MSSDVSSLTSAYDSSPCKQEAFVGKTERSIFGKDRNGLSTGRGIAMRQRVRRLLNAEWVKSTSAISVRPYIPFEPTHRERKNGGERKNPYPTD